MPDRIEEQLTSLSRIDSAGLRQRWREMFGLPAPNLRRNLMIRVLAYKIQERAFGGLDPEKRRRLQRLARMFETNSNSTIPSALGIKPGTRLVRQWRDQVHVVTVEAKGYAYQNTQYHSLSEIARRITGTRWSGPLFFGLKAINSANSNEGV